MASKKVKKKKHEIEYLYASANFSECGKYRYLLTRLWDNSKPTAMCIGLNPSTANGIDDDQTISWLTAILKHHGYGQLLMTNLYAIISSEPEKIFDVSDPQKENNKWLSETAESADAFIYCWGDFSHIEYRAKQVQKMFPNGLCFGRTANKMPWHPLANMYNGFTAETTKIIPYK